MEDSRPIFSSKRFSYNENALYYCLSNFGRCGRSRDRVSVKCPLVDPRYPPNRMAEQQFHTVISPLDIDGTGQNWEYSENSSQTLWDGSFAPV